MNRLSWRRFCRPRLLVGLCGLLLAGLVPGVAAAALTPHLYWANSGNSTIGWANLDGGSVNQSLIGGVNYPYGVAVDGQHLYWINAGGPALGRANLDGSAVNQSFISGLSGPQHLAVLAAPGAPFDVSVSSRTGQATVSFAAPSGNGSAVTGYTVTSSGGQTCTTTTLSCTVTGLSAGSAYTFSVTATNGVGTSLASNSVAVGASGSESGRVTVCAATAQTRVGEPAGRFLSIYADDWTTNARTNPLSALYDTTPAVYVQGYGTMCQLSDVATYGGDPSRFVDSGYTVDQMGHSPQPGSNPTDSGALYEYYATRP
jgi:hypothetical protein